MSILQKKKWKFMLSIITKSVSMINYSTETVEVRETPEAFEEFVEQLINHIDSQKTVRYFKTNSLNKDAIRYILEIAQQNSGIDLRIKNAGLIANKLLEAEVAAQERVNKMSVDVQKGSLIQALLYDENEEKYKYLLAKVEHSDFIDDKDFGFRTGYAKNKGSIWKSALFDLGELSADSYIAKVYTNTSAKFWSKSFLELEELLSDSVNTQKSFDAIDVCINKFKKAYPKDAVYIRNAFIVRMRQSGQVNYDKMINEVLGNYTPFQMDLTKLNEIKEKLFKLPDEKKFERQFDLDPNQITARIRKLFDVTPGIQLRISEGLPNMASLISSYRDDDGKQFLKICTTNKETFESFYKE